MDNPAAEAAVVVDKPKKSTEGEHDIEQQSEHMPLVAANEFSWKRPSYMESSTCFGSFVEWEVGLQMKLQNFDLMKPVAYVTHHALHEEVIFLTMPILVWLLTPRHALNALGCACFSELINGAIKWLLCVPRPFWVFKGVRNISNCWEGDFSTPSGHTQFVVALMACYCFEFYHNATLWVVSTCICILTGICRVFTGVHYIHDVVGAWFMGVACAYLWAWMDPIHYYDAEAKYIQQISMLLLFIVIPPIILSLVRCIVPPFEPAEEARYEAHAKSKLQGFTEEKLSTYKIKSRSMYTYTAVLGSLAGGMAGSLIESQMGWHDYFQLCTWEDTRFTVIRALCGMAVQLFLFAIVVVTPKLLVTKCGVPDLAAEVFKYIAFMGTTMWAICWLHLSQLVGIPACSDVYTESSDFWPEVFPSGMQ